MRKISMLAATLLLSGICAVAQTTPSSQPTDQSTSPSTSSPSSTSPTSPSQSTSPSSSMPSQSSAQDSSATSTGNSNSIEGCLSGSAGSYTLTDQSGKTWQLSGDTSKLTEHVGHQVQIMGSSNDSSNSASGSTGSTSSSATSGSSSGSGGASSGGSSFNVHRVKMISSSCSTK